LLKAIFFPSDGTRGDIKYRHAIGLEWTVDLGDQDKGIGTGSDVIVHFYGLSLGLKNGTSLIPLVQHYVSYS
jgi:hypothetical protein